MVNKLTSVLSESINAELPLVMDKFSINTPLRMSHFLSQCAHESANFSIFKENLNYSADALLRVFPKYFKDKATADAYARQPEKIANRVYANRMGNGDEASGDGWKYRGRGAIQLTGKNNYAAFDKFVDDDILANPDLVATKYAVTSAAFWWSNNGLNAVADKGATNADVTAVTKRVNGGTHGLADRQAKFDKYKSILLT